jgi:hypothetical protein
VAVPPTITLFDVAPYSSMMQEWNFWRKCPLTNLNAMADETGNKVRQETKGTDMKILFSDCCSEGKMKMKLKRK